MLDAVKKTLSITVDAYDDELSELIEAAQADLRVTAGVTEAGMEDPLVRQAIKTYCKANFKNPSNHDQLQASYESQKGALRIATGYTNWGDE